MKKKNKIGLAIAVLGLTVGYAAISTTLYINGTATIKANSDDFKNKVIFTAANATNGASATITNSGKTIVFTTQEFSSIGDNTELTYTIGNTSNYDAKLGNPDVVCTADTGAETDYATYLTVGQGTELDGKTITRGGNGTDTLSVELKQSYVDDTAKSITFTCTITADAVEAGN